MIRKENETIICPNCQIEIKDVKTYECSNCGVIVKVPSARKEEPQRIFLTTVESENYNGIYNVYLLSNGTFFCSCYAFLFQKDLEEREGQVICKHIKKLLRNKKIIPTQVRNREAVSEWQKLLFKKLNIIPHPNLTREQAYWVIREIFSKMDMQYKDFVYFICKNPTYELIPMFHFGLELEGLVKSRILLYERLKQEGLRVKLTGYSHEMGNELWKIGDDNSVRQNMSSEENAQYESVEITSPKLFGIEGLKKVEKVLRIWNELGSRVNIWCGFHVHVDASSFDERDIARLILTWMKIENVIYFLVSPSRRMNLYARMLRDAYSQVWGRLITGLTEKGDRYYAVNRNAYERFKTIEFRIHQGTTDFEKVKNWVLFCLKFMEKVKAGLKWSDFSEEPTIEEVLDKLGFVDNAVPLLVNARKYFLERYNKFKTEADGICLLSSFEPELIKKGIQEALENAYYNFNYFHFYYLNLIERGEVISSTSYLSQARHIARGRIPYEEIKKARRGNEFYFNENGVSVVVSSNPIGNDKRLSCTCEEFAKNERCSHTIHVARFLIVEEKVKKIRRFFDNLDF
jgi:predicted nucleic acid-binding Zn finger protein